MRVGVNGSPLSTGSLTAPSATFRLPLHPAGLLGLALLALSGCGVLQDQSGGSGAMTTASPAALMQSADPMTAFAARATPGQEELVGNPPVRARVMRAYNSGGGRPCRELRLGNASTGTPALYCEASPGVWTSVRPLLGTGQVAARP